LGVKNFWYQFTKNRQAGKKRIVEKAVFRKKSERQANKGRPRIRVLRHEGKKSWELTSHQTQHTSNYPIAEVSGEIANHTTGDVKESSKVKEVNK